ncbi:MULTISPECIES: tetratricopeptide repeat protein [Bradyrhizobium]|jgi:tetratricopeptide (TPR) repeat protein|uniref:Tetratricopeptide repeat protein n=3 Tax=Bradyrhizobium barranii TaxID=2992140 RepID=A0A7Z0TPA4_9BRAD|nr:MULTISPECIES: tetratricopeptide repeat protein [Bradyrhizobium]MCK1276325.1 tetratricopeptide repeat protein [Bradyrhizobium sp. 61]MCK1448530.1 tetratricopeptide repeat protein [Bradyrhizobium sp. 48]MCK1464085.1 tetratricopeptide repeat protein [Bradyrhizobium sp. 2]TFW60689.1 tetratricopeptide repeat protein [Bradyrhizobium sp. MOS001]UEM14203.1 tetratricopeptide repeat protein [Bradyrhizobium barranii subsp. barranii]
MAVRFLAVSFPFARTLCLALVLGATGLTPALAQKELPAPPGKEQKKLPEAPAKLPKVDRSKNLDFLFGALKAAPDEASAKHVEARIWAIWIQTPSDTASLLMARAKTAVDAQKIDIAIKLLDSVIKLRPDYIEAWNRRATLYYMQNDYGRSLADIREVLIREPRHFGALAGLGMIMQEVGDEKRALEAYRKALAVNPHLEKIPEQVKALTEKVEGRDI